MIYEAYYIIIFVDLTNKMSNQIWQLLGRVYNLKAVLSAFDRT